MSPTAKASERRKIHSRWFEDREEWKETKVQLPGWSRVELESNERTPQGEPRIYPAGCEDFVYRHENMPKGKLWGPTNEWYFPFHVPDISDTTVASMPEQTPYLFARTQRVRAWGRRIENVTHKIVIYDKLNGRMFGTLRLQSLDQIQLLQNSRPGMEEHVCLRELHTLDPAKEATNVAHEELPSENQVEIEIIVISLTRSCFKYWNEDASRFDRTYSHSGSYNVLWIEWQDGIAYRKAAGAACKRCWDKLEPEDVDLVLG